MNYNISSQEVRKVGDASISINLVYPTDENVIYSKTQRNSTE